MDVALLVKVMADFSHGRFVTVKSATGLGQTVTVDVAESLHVLEDDRTTYLIVCVPTPAVPGLNSPLTFTPIPVNVAILGTSGSKLASVIVVVLHPDRYRA